LDCGNNQLTTLDVSANVALTNLYCHYNQLTTLDVSANTTVTVLWCNNNQLTTLDVSANTALTDLLCRNNQLTTLDVSANTALLYLKCNSNQLTTLNVKNGNNKRVLYFDARSNLNLTCIQVDDSTYSTNKWTNIDATASFSEECARSGINENFPSLATSFYPNPTKNQIYFSVQTNVHLTNVTGQIIMDRKNVNTLNLSALPTGIYFLIFTDKKGQVTQRSKIVKE